MSLQTAKDELRAESQYRVNQKYHQDDSRDLEPFRAAYAHLPQRSGADQILICIRALHKICQRREHPRDDISRRLWDLEVRVVTDFGFCRMILLRALLGRVKLVLNLFHGFANKRLAGV